MKKLLILAFCLYHFPLHAVTIDTVVCVDHVKRVAHVYHNVPAPDDYEYLSIAEIRNIVCNRIKQSKRNKRGN